jgi:DNA-binding LacI/PurR family transcriptional regulator
VDGGVSRWRHGKGWRSVSPKRTGHVAMRDVAGLAGVSHQTVSRVLNDHPNVREATRRRVKAAMAELGYRPNHAARTLVTGRSRTVNVVTQSTTLYGPASLLAAFELAASDAGYSVGVSSVRALDQQSISEAVARALEQGTAGLVIIAPVEAAARAVSEVPIDVPRVIIDGDPESPTGLVTVDQRAGAGLATQYLLDRGHPTVWHVSGPPGWFDSAGRIAGWRETLAAAGAEIPPPVPADWTPEAGYQAGLLLARMPEVTAVFAANDHLALGIMKALRERRRSVPDEVSIIGFDDIPVANFVVPPLTTVRPDFAAVGRMTMESLAEQMEAAPPPAVARTVAPVLVERESVADGPLASAGTPGRARRGRTS